MLSVPPAFVLSQDQTLYLSCILILFFWEIWSQFLHCRAASFFSLCLTSLLLVSSKQFPRVLCFSLLFNFQDTVRFLFKALNYYITLLKACQALFENIFYFLSGSLPPSRQATCLFYHLFPSLSTLFLRFYVLHKKLWCISIHYVLNANTNHIYRRIYA